MENLIVNIDGKEYIVKVEELDDKKLRVHFSGEVFTVETKEDIPEEVEGYIEKKGGEIGKNIIRAPLPGTIFSVLVKKGQKVKKDQTLLKLIAMKIENDITATKDGSVKDIRVKKNDGVNKGDILVILE